MKRRSRMLCVALIFSALFLTACSSKKDDPVSVLQNFILLCEKGELDKAQKLITKRNNVDYFRTYRDMGKDLIFIDYDYKGNDNVVRIDYELLENLSSDDVAVVKMTTNYKKQNHTFDKNVVLHKIDGQWKIFEYLFMPVKVN